MIGFLPSAMRVTSHCVVTVADGLFAGLPVEGVDYVLIKRDGFMVIDSRGVIVLPSGLVAAYTLNGYRDAPAEMPPPEGMLDLESEFPNEDFRSNGVEWFETMVPE